jgi:hypothetical protein
MAVTKKRAVLRPIHANSLDFVVVVVAATLTGDARGESTDSEEIIVLERRTP